MKRIFFLILIASLPAFSQVTSLSTTFKLARWTAGNKLSAGTIGDTAQSNASLNYNFDRIEALFSRQIDKDGWFTKLYGPGDRDLDIAARGSHAYRITMSDSVYGYLNWQTEGSLLVQQNVYVGGYITLDSIITNNNVWIQNDLSVGNVLTVYDSLTVYGLVNINTGPLEVGAPFSLGGIRGIINLYNTTNDYKTIIYPTAPSGADRRFTIPALSMNSTAALSDANQNFTDVGYIVSDSIVSDNVSYLVYAQQVSDAGSANNDTSGYSFTEWQQENNTYTRKARFLYTHKSGVKELVAYFQGMVNSVDVSDGTFKMEIFSLDGTLKSTGTTSITNTVYASKTVTTTASGLTNNTSYYVDFSLRHNDGVAYIIYAKQLSVMAESN